MKSSHKATVFALLLAAGAPAVPAAPASVVPGGYDPVLYSEDGRLVRGHFRYSHVHDGQVFIFKTQHNRDRFVIQPERYASGEALALESLPGHDG